MLQAAAPRMVVSSIFSLPIILSLPLTHFPSPRYRPPASPVRSKCAGTLEEGRRPVFGDIAVLYVSERERNPFLCLGPARTCSASFLSSLCFVCFLSACLCPMFLSAHSMCGCLLLRSPTTSPRHA